MAPDCLGYGGTSKPLDMQAYKGKAMSDDIAEILEHEKIEKVIGIGHDWYACLELIKALTAADGHVIGALSYFLALRTSIPRSSLNWSS